MDAHRSETANLRRDLQVGFAGVDGRMAALEARLETLIEKALREQTQFFFLAWAVLLAAFIGLYARR
jgi:hypothetical protein